MKVYKTPREHVYFVTGCTEVAAVLPRLGLALLYILAKWRTIRTDFVKFVKRINYNIHTNIKRVYIKQKFSYTI